MIIAIVKVKIPEGLSLADYRAMTKEIAPRFQAIAGLERKQFLYSREEGVAGGVYLWQSREAAEVCYRGPWRDSIRKAFGAEPEITFFDCPVVVDNRAGKILTILEKVGPEAV